MAKLLTERFQLTANSRVDRSDPDHPVIRDVLLCGASSANGRRYRREAFAGEKVKRYADKPVFLNHGTGREPRRYQDRIAKVVRPRHRATDGMPVGDLAVNPKHPYGEALLWDAQHNPTSCGMSHVAQCETVRGRDGVEEITDVVSVESVDLVLDPATTRGFHESTTKRKGKTMKLNRFLTERVLYARAATQRHREAAAAAVDAAPDADVDVGAGDAMDASDIANSGGEEVTAALRQGYQAALAAVVATALDKPPKEVARRIEKLVAAFQGATKGGAAESRIGWQDDFPGTEKRVTWQDDPAPAGGKKTVRERVTWDDDPPGEKWIGWQD